MKKTDTAKKAYLVILTDGGFDHTFYLIEEDGWDRLHKSEEYEDWVDYEDENSPPSFSTAVEAFEDALKNHLKLVDELHFTSY